MTVLAVTAPILTINAVIKAGTTWSLQVSVVDALNNPIVTTFGWLVRCQVRATPSSAVLFEWNLTPSTGQGLATFSSSMVTLSLQPSDSAAWTWTSGNWDCLLTDPSSKVACLFDGSVSVGSLNTH